MTSETMLLKAKINSLPVVIFKGSELGTFPQSQIRTPAYYCLPFYKDFKT